jgi:nitrogen regulatory protein P-II 1
MRKIEAVIRPHRVDAVQRALRAIGFPGVMVTEMSGHGRQHGGQEGWPEDIRETFLPKVKLEIVVANDKQELVVATIVKAAKTGEPGDGKIFITEVKEAIRVRTGERGEEVVAWVPPDKEGHSRKPKKR